MEFDSIFGRNVQPGDVFSFKSISLPLVEKFLSQECGRKPIVIDFALANHNIVQTVAQYESIYISTSALTSNLIESAQHRADETENFFDEQLKSHLSILDKYKDSASIGAILVWDTFQYLSRESIIAIMAHLSPLCMKGACLSAFVWQSDRIPKIPGAFSTVEMSRVEYQIKTLETTATQFLLAAQSMVNMMPSFAPLRILASDSGVFDITLEFSELAEPPDPRIIPLDQLTGHYR